MTASPLRIQRTRKKGGGYLWPGMEKGNVFILNSLPVVYVGRPSVWGNPFYLSEFPRARSVELYKKLIVGNYPKKIIKEYLGGKNLACWCPLDQPCHADILLGIANK